MSTFNSPSDVEPVTRVRAEDINNLDAAVAAAFALLPDETKMKDGRVNFGTDSGIADAYVVTAPYTPSGYVDGLTVLFIPLHTNTGAATVNVQGLGVKSIRLPSNSALSAGMLTAGVPTEICFSTTTGYFHLLGVTGEQGPPGPAGGVSSVNVSGGTTGLTVSGGPVTSSGTMTIAGTLSAANGGSGVANNAAATTTRVGNFSWTVTLTGNSAITFPVSGTAATLDGSETLTNKTLTAPQISSLPNLSTNGALWATGGVGTLNSDTLPSAYGGTGFASYTDGQFPLGRTSDGTLQKGTIAAGANITVTYSANVITIAETAPTALTLISSGAPSSASSIDITTGIDGTYEEYELHILNLMPATSADNLWCRTSANAGGAWDAGTSYDYATTAGATAGAAQIVLAVGISATTADGGVTGVIRITDPAGTASNKRINFQGSFVSSAPTPAVITAMGIRKATAAINGIRLLFSTGNIASGKWKLYGVKKS